MDTVIAKYLKPLAKTEFTISDTLAFPDLIKNLTNSDEYEDVSYADGCPMGGPIYVGFSDLYMCKIELDVVVPAKPLFYKHYIDDTYVRRKKNIRDMLFEGLNSYHQNIKLTVEVNPSRFLDTELIREERSILSQVFNKPHKFSVH